MDKIWLRNYPPGVPTEINTDRFTSLPAILEWASQHYPERDAFVNQGTAIKFRELHELAQGFAAYLQHVVRLAPGDRVAIMSPNLLQYPIALFGILLAGGVVVNTNPLYTARELEHQLLDSGATVVIVLENFAHTLAQVLEKTKVRHVIVTGVGDMLGLAKGAFINFAVKHLRHMVPQWRIANAVEFKEALATGRLFELVRVELNAGDTAFLQYTGGTTGVPKAAVLTHGNVIANQEQTVAWVTGVLREGEEVMVIPLPLYHIFALMALFAFVRLGASIVLITNPRDIPQLIKELKHSKFTVMIGVNTLFNALLNAGALADIPTNTLKLVIAGGMAVQRSVAERWAKVFGTQMIEGYGLTECSPIVCANPLNISEFTGCIGLPLPSTDIAICDDGGRELAQGEKGEILVSGPQVMKEYWNRPEETKKVITGDGWLRTGDIGFVDSRGYVKLVDRKKDVIIVSGFKVFPNEVEEVVAMHEGVFEVAAISAADDRSEHAVKIIVVRKDQHLTTEELAAHCRKYLTAYKVPKYIVFRDAPLPKSNIGKILRRLVQDEEDQAVST